MKTITLPAIAAVILSTSIALHAGSSAGAATSQSQAEIEDIGEIEAIDEGQSAGAAGFRFNVGGRAEYTSNARLTGDHSSSDVLWLPSIELGYGRALAKGVNFDIAGKVESVFYTQNDELAFIGYSITTTLDWRPRPGLPRLYVAAEPYRYDSFDTGNMVTQALGVTAGTDWGTSFNNGSSLLFLGTSFSHYFADPDIDSRNTWRATVGFTHQIRPALFAQLFYSYQLSTFINDDRQDSRNVVGVNLTYQFNRHLFGNIGGSFVDNQSDEARADYQSAGASVGFTWQF